jgi:putative FmdB family regulatory protein
VPLYEFQCEKCHHRFEKIQSVAAPDPKCEKCGSKVERLLHAPAVQFKGSGWYATDYAKSGKSRDTAEGKAGDKADASSNKTETKSDSKSESKAETRTESSASSKE